MSEHMRDTVAHMALLENEIKKLKEFNKHLEHKEEATRREYKGLSEVIDTHIVTEELYQKLEQKQKATEKLCQEMESKLRASENEVKELREELKRNLGELPIDFPVKKKRKGFALLLLLWLLNVY